MEEIQHFSHHHALTFCMPRDQGADDHEEPQCFFCASYIRGPAYNCKICRYFWLHKSCTELSEEKEKHPFHSAHSLFLQLFQPTFICDGCQELCSGLSYLCRWCTFFLCVKCGCLTYEEAEASKGAQAKTTIQHFSHDHQLTRCNVKSMEELSFLSCVACKKLLSGPSYVCDRCKTFRLHESCVNDMPQEEFEHPFHPQHRLLPQPQSSYVNDLKICNACHEDIWGIRFSCVDCSFYMHASCVKFKPRAIKHHIHEHDLFYFGPRHIGRCQKCHFCGESCSASFFCCVVCQFDIHIECLPLPDHVKHNRHFHPLTLKDAVVDDLEEQYCDICETERNPEHPVYYCKECNYTVHIDCVICQVEPPEDILSYLVPRTKNIELKEKNVETKLKISDSKAKKKSGKDISSEEEDVIETNHEDWVLSELEGEIKNLQEGVEILTAKIIGLDPSSLLPSPKLAKKIQHFNHKHTLIFCALSGKNCLCNSCGYEIHGSAYACEELCDFNLHKSCSELPREIEKHPLHLAHSLVLIQDNDLDDYLLCDGCKEVFCGQRYICKWCRVSFDIKCALLTDEEAMGLKGCVQCKNTILHFSHTHHLTRCSISDKLKFSCNGCKEAISSPSYACVDCRFFLHESCVNDMPQEVETQFHPQHHLLAQYTESFHTICDACYTIIEGFMFECFDCQFRLHASCANYKTRTIKHEYHEHDLLYFGPRNIGRRARCKSCRQICETPFFCCIICNLDIHLECLPLPLIVKHKRHFHPLTLRDSIVEDDWGGYYCDICETERNPEHYMYYCEECNYTTHIDCVISQVEPPEEILSYMILPTENVESEQKNDETESEINDSKAKEGSNIEELVHSEPEEGIENLQEKVEALIGSLELVQGLLKKREKLFHVMKKRSIN